MINKLLKRILACTLSLALVLTCLAFSGCSQSESSLYGWVYAGSPVSSAALSIYDTSGKQIHKRDRLSVDELGAIMIGTSKTLPSDFRIVADGGNLNGEAFIAKLCADIRGYDAQKDTIYINLATTIVSAYLDKNPASSLAEASLAVKNFLEIPDTVDLASGAQLSDEYFNINQFLTQAGENGGVNPFIDKLLEQMSKGETHPFNEPPLLQGGIASSLATSLAEGAASYVGGELMGWGLAKAGVNFGEEDHTAEELAKIQEGMADMKVQLTEMSTKLDAISDKLDNIITQLNDMLKQITHQQALSEYGIRVHQLDELFSAVYSIRRDLNSFVMNPPQDPKAKRDSLTDRIKNNIIDKADIVNSQLVSGAGDTPLLTMWREIVYENRFLDSEDYDRVKAQYEYFKQYQDAILLLQVEYYHATEQVPGENEAIIMDCINRYESNIQKQEALLARPIEKNTVIDTRRDGMYYSENIVFSKEGTSYALNGKTKKQVIADMAALAASNYAGYTDWVELNNTNITPLGEGHILDKAPLSWPEYMINQGWPGAKVEVEVKGKPGEKAMGSTVVPFYKPTKGYDFMYMLNDSSHLHIISDFPDAGFKQDADFCVLMVYRKAAAKDFGYEHLK